jgi:hypothetical protein
MQLGRMLDQCQRLEERAAALYRAYAASARAEPAFCALWTALAREEEAHAQAIAMAHAKLEATQDWRTHLNGWTEAMADTERRLEAAERLRGETSTARQLSAALDVELSELDALRHVVLAACREPATDGVDTHAERLADEASRLTDDPHVRLQVALLRARARLRGR